jgi:hypothetical protein
VQAADEDGLYAAMDWLLARQERIQRRLAERHLSEGGLALYDLSSGYFEGSCCPLGEIGHNRDGKKNKLQVNYGLLTNHTSAGSYWRRRSGSSRRCARSVIGSRTASAPTSSCACARTTSSGTCARRGELMADEQTAAKANSTLRRGGHEGQLKRSSKRTGAVTIADPTYLERCYLERCYLERCCLERPYLERSAT